MGNSDNAFDTCTLCLKFVKTNTVITEMRDDIDTTNNNAFQACISRAGAEFEW